MTISQKRPQRLWDPSWVKVGCCASKYLCLVTQTRSESQQKVSWWFSLRPVKNFPSFHFQWVGSLVGVAGSVASSPDEWHHHLDVGDVYAVGQGVSGAGSPMAVDGWGEMTKRAAKDMFPINNCRGYMSTPCDSEGQTCSTTLQAVRKDWQSLTSSSMASLSISCIHSPCDCCRMWVHSAQVVSASLIAAAHVASASWIAVTQQTLTSLMALAVWASFWWKVVLKSDTCFLQWVSMDTLVVSRGPMVLLISSCSWSTSSERALGSIPGWVLGCGAAGTLVALGVSDARVREDEWLIGTASSGLAACSDACWDVATSLGMAKTGLSSLSGSSSLMINGANQTTGIGLLRMLSPEFGQEVSNTIWDKSSWSLVAMLVQLATLLGHSAGKCRKIGGVEALQGPGTKGILSLGIACGRSTWSTKDSWTGLPWVFVSHTGSYGTESCTGSSLPI